MREAAKGQCSRDMSGNDYFRLTLRDLLVFEVLSDTKSTTIAAERLGVTQSAVSQSVKRLEMLLGVTLLDRSNRPLGRDTSARRVEHSSECARHGR